MVIESEAASPRSYLRPVQAIAGQPVVQQFGLSLFNLYTEEEKVELLVTFDQPFADANYVLVATSSQSDAFAVVKEKLADCAILELVRLKSAADIQGIVNWIAIGPLSE